MLVVATAADIDTRAITRRLREEGSLIGVLTTENSKTDDELIEMAKTWKIAGTRSNRGNCKLLCYAILRAKVNVHAFKRQSWCPWTHIGRETVIVLTGFVTKKF